MNEAVQVHAAPDTLPVPANGAAAPSQAAAAAVRAGTGKSPNTIRAYASAWKGFCTWCESQRNDPCPASPDTVALYLEARAQAGKSSGALRLDFHAIKEAHREARRAARATGADHTAFVDPTENMNVRDVLRAHARTARRARPSKQAEPLTLEALAAIEATACKPRPREHPEQAVYRGEQDVALIRVMRDALLRREEASRLTWGDLYTLKDGTATVSIHGRKTTDGTVTKPLVKRTVKALMKLYPPAAARGKMDVTNRPLFVSDRADYSTGRRSLRGLSPASISNRIRAAAKHAGLENADNFSGHSPRVGMALDLARAGASTLEVQLAGDWKSPDMPAYYCRSVRAGENAVAVRMADQ